jgi:hypothetical protein
MKKVYVVHGILFETMVYIAVFDNMKSAEDHVLFKQKECEGVYFEAVERSILE